MDFDVGEKEIVEKIYQRVLHFLSFRPRSEKEIRDFISRKLKQTEERNRIIDEILHRLKEEKLVNDSEFADWWIDQRLEFNPKGPKIIRGELLFRGIDRELVEEKISNIKRQQLKKAAFQIMGQKAKSYVNLDLIEKKNKLVKLLLMRGFEYDLSKQLVDEFPEKE